MRIIVGSRAAQQAKKVPPTLKGAIDEHHRAEQRATHACHAALPPKRKGFHIIGTTHTGAAKLNAVKLTDGRQHLHKN